MRVIEILLALGEVATTQVRHLVFFFLLALRKVTDVAFSGIRLGFLPSCKIWGRRTLGFLLVVAHLYLSGRWDRTNGGESHCAPRGQPIATAARPVCANSPQGSHAALPVPSLRVHPAAGRAPGDSIEAGSP